MTGRETAGDSTNPAHFVLPRLGSQGKVRLASYRVTAIASDVGGSQGDGLYQALGGTGSMPMTAFYSSSEKLLATHVGAFDSSTLASELDQLYRIHVA
ncbi:MAG: hypothetical protein M0Z95_01285 [Actinomycetota bacterium]|jgi:hypothetical protein|nr:hypothetical protein [Actinomycetota bacterium]